MLARQRPLVFLAIVSLLTGGLAGCLGQEDEPAPQSIDAPPVNNSTETNATLPEGRGESSGLKETNQTEKGVGGMEHKHDYWNGKQQIVVFDDAATFDPLPLYPDGEGSSAKSVAYVKLPQPFLVYEGADRIQIVATEVQTGDPGWPAPDDLAAPHPAPADFLVQHRTAASSEWTDPQPLDLDTPLEIPVNALEADMPHSVQSLWAWRITTERPDFSRIHLTITVFKGGEVVDWPGHPEFYADRPWRVVVDEQVSTSMVGIQEGWVYDGSGTWVNPDRLVSYGTTRLEVYINVTGFSSAPGADYEYIFLEHHNATVLGPEIKFGNRTRDADWSEDGSSWNFTLDVRDPNGMDGPYQPASRWGFRAMATFAKVGVDGIATVGLCPGCFPYEIDYQITIVAWNDDWVPPVDEI